MKKSMILATCAVAMTAGLMASCGNKKADENKDAEMQVTEMVEAVEKPLPKRGGEGINKTRYNASFFENPANKAEVATDSTYAVTPSGLKYVIASEGNGVSPTATDNVTVHYVGTLTNGEQFDSSIDRGEPTTFPLNRVIPGWTEGLQLMKEGGTAVFYIPSELAYGDRELPGIPASSTLLFWVELIQVN